jgi:hypothetical protein
VGDVITHSFFYFTPLIMDLLREPNVRIKVSSVLNKDTVNYGKQHLLDDNQETCWQSDQGSNQKIVIDFGKMVQIDHINIMFQGGFASRVCTLLSGTNQLGTFYPEDNNTLQSFPIQSTHAISKCTLLFQECTDNYGRIIIYQLNIIGRSAD